MPDAVRWIDLLDPSEDELLAAAPVALHARAVQQLTAPTAEHGPRPTFESHGDYVLGVIVAAVVVPDEDRVYYQEIGLVLTPHVAVTVRKTPAGGAPLDLETVERAVEAHGEPTAGVVALAVADHVAEQHLHLLDELDAEIEELEDGVDEWPADKIRRRISELRHDVLQIRRTLTPTRDAVRAVVDGRADVAAGRIFDRDLQLDFGGVYDKLLRATELLDVSRELIVAAREHYEARVAQEQNEVVKKLTVIASLLLLPTFIVGVYGQNFDHMPELGWHLGYAFSWALVVASTIAQLAFFRWRRWI